MPFSLPNLIMTYREMNQSLETGQEIKMQRAAGNEQLGFTAQET